MDGYSISQAAQRSGFSQSALRFYDQNGLVRPGRTASGYRTYDDADLDRLAFIRRAKGFGLSLEEITDLLDLLSENRCAPVQDRLRALIATRIDDAETRAAELAAFSGELRQVSATLDGPAPDGPCDDSCGCITDPGPAPVAGRTQPTEPPIACTLGPGEYEGRVGEWQALADRATARSDVPGGVRLRFPRTVDLPALASLVAAEQGCCRFFTFTLTVADAEVLLDVTAPPDARPMVETLVGATS